MYIQNLSEEQWNFLPYRIPLKQWSKILRFGYEGVWQQIKLHIGPKHERLGSSIFITKPDMQEYIETCKNIDLIPIDEYLKLPNYLQNDSLDEPRRTGVQRYEISGFESYYIKNRFENLCWENGPEYGTLPIWSKFLKTSPETAWRWSKMCGLRHYNFQPTILIYKYDLMRFLRVGLKSSDPIPNRDDIAVERLFEGF